MPLIEKFGVTYKRVEPEDPEKYAKAPKTTKKREEPKTEITKTIESTTKKTDMQAWEELSPGVTQKVTYLQEEMPVTQQKVTELQKEADILQERVGVVKTGYAEVSAKQVDVYSKMRELESKTAVLETRMEKAKKEVPESPLLKALETQEKLVAKITTPLRTKKAELLETAKEYKGTTKEPLGAIAVGTAMTLSIGAGFVEGLTLPLRPLAIGATVTSLAGLITDQEMRRATALSIKTDPVGFTGEVTGGLIGGYSFGKAQTFMGKKLGIIKPPTYKLESKIVSVKDVKQPASIMPKGKWRATWEITRKGGTAVTLLKETPDFAQVYRPIPVYTPSIIPPITGIMGALKGVSLPKIANIPTLDKPIQTTYTEQITDLWRIRLERPISRIKITPQQRTEEEEKPILVPWGIQTPRIKPSLREREDYELVSPLPISILKPISIPDTRPTVTPRQTPDVITIPDITPKIEEVQEQIPKQTVITTTIPFTPNIPSVKPIPKLIKKKRRRRGELELDIFGEVRTYPIKKVEKMLKGL